MSIISGMNFLSEVNHINNFHFAVMLGEILPGKIRGTAASVATAFNWMCTFIVTKTFNDLISELV